MKKTLFYFFVITLLSSVWSCSDEKENEVRETLIVSDKQLSFKASAETKTISIKSNTKWEFENITESWIKVSPMSGEGDMTVNIEVLENLEETNLNAKLTIKTNVEVRTISISQKGADPIIEDPEGHYFPLVTINTKDGETIVSKDYYLDATVTIEARNEKGIVTEKLLEVETEIKGRGNSTWGMEKKPYRLKLKESSKVLDMPKNKHWVLLANYADKTLMRNELAFEVSRRMGFAYTPRMQHVDVVLNGDYIGNYMLGEHIRVDKNRVNIAELEPTDEDITGGYLLEIDERKGEPVWFETQKAKMIFCVNRPEDIPQNQKDYISNHIQHIENIIYGVDGINTMEELPKYLDMKSFIDYFLLNELSKNVDGNLRLSTYLYKDRGDDKVYFGPAWDYDISFGNVDYNGCEKTDGWYARTNADWYKELFKHPEFEQSVINRWKELRGSVLADLHTFIDDLALEMEISQMKNFNRWKILNIKVWPNPIVTGSYAGEMNYLKSWVTYRLNWIDQQLK